MRLLLLFIVHFYWVAAFGQGHTTMLGKVMNNGSGDPVASALVTLYKQEVIISQSQTDREGNYAFRNIEIGNYTIVVTKFGFPPLKISDVEIVNEYLEMNLAFDGEGYSSDTLHLSYEEVRPNRNKKWKKCPRKRNKRRQHKRRQR